MGCDVSLAAGVAKKNESFALARSSWGSTSFLYGSAWFCCGACGSAGARHSLQSPLRRLCGMQKSLPPHSLHVCFCLPWMQRPDPPHSAQYILRFLCLQISEPPQSLHRSLRLPWMQVDTPPHRLHLALRRPCSQCGWRLSTTIVATSVGYWDQAIA